MPSCKYVQAPSDILEKGLRYSEIDEAFGKLCKMFAKCNLTGSEQHLAAAFMEKMNAACAQQQLEGDNATWYVVNYRNDKQE